MKAQGETQTGMPSSNKMVLSGQSCMEHTRFCWRWNTNKQTTADNAMSSKQTAKQTVVWPGQSVIQTPDRS